MTTWFFSLQTDTFYSKIKVRLDAVPFFLHTEPPHTEREVYTMRTPRLRLLSVLLAVALFFTLLPVSALAEGGGSNANTGLTIGIVGNLNQWDESHSISMKEVSPAVYEVTIENKSYGDINGSVGFLFVKDNSYADQWGSSVTASSGELYDAVYGGDYIKIDPGSDAEESTHNFIIRLDLTNWDWNTKTGATFTVTVAAATNTFYFNPTTGTITKYIESDTVVVIPSKINGVTVETIGHGAFERSAVTSVTIPDSVTAILDRAFANCSQLTNISIPNSVTSIDFSAFEHCTSLKSITLPSSLRNISMFLFHNCSQLTTIQIPDSVLSIQDYAFGNCISLETIHIPVSVTSIGVYAFNGCPSSMTVTYSGSKKQWDSIKGKDELLNIPLVCNKLQATFNPNNGDPTVTKFIDNDKNSKFAELVPEPTKENYTFAGWYNGNEKFDFTTVPTGDVTLTAKWTANDYEVSFVTEHGKAPTSQNVPYNGTATDPGKLSAEGYTFDDWYADEAHKTKFDFTQPIKSNTTVYAKWTAKDYEVSFITEHGNAPTSQNVPYNEPATDPGELTAEGYTFDGWYAEDNTKFDFTQPIKHNTTVYAKWTANDYEVSFITEHGDAPASQNVKYNGTAKDPGKLSAEGYTFIGWYTDHTCTTEFDFSTPITGDTKVYAKWEKNAPVLPDTYALNVSGAFVYVDGVDVTAPAGDTSLLLEKDASVRLVADPDRMPSGMVFDRWTILNGALNADDAEKFETGRTLEEFAFTMPAEPLSIEATPRMQEEEGSDTASVIAGVTLGTAATALVAWQAYDLGMSLYQEHWLPADFVMPKTRAELALLLWNTAGRPAPAAQPAFTDIPDPDTAQAAQWAVETGLMTPKSADRFKPEKSVTRWKAIRSWKRVTNQNT